MDNKGVLKIPAKFINIVGACVGVILILLEAIICVQYVSIDPMPDSWRIGVLFGCSAVIIVLFFVEFYVIKTLKARIVMYCFDFLLLLGICALTGSAYIAGLYGVILTQLYINVEEMRTKVIVLVFSCIMFTLTCVFGLFLNRMRIVSLTEIMDIAFACLVGLIILGLHFAVVNFLLGFYRTNSRLTKALKEADENKKQLEEAYTQLEQTAVFQERNRIARDIHDNAGHSMTAVIMQTEAAKLLIDSNPEEAKTKIISANIQAKNALEQMRESVHLLAGRDSSRSLKEEIEEIIAQTMDGTDVIVRYDIADIQLSGDRRRFIANSLKECFSNGMRHGGAGAFYVELSMAGEYVCLIVSDNGCGLPADFKEGFGLRGIREKAAQFGGGIVFESESGDGCEIKITIKEE